MTSTAASPAQPLLVRFARPEDADAIARVQVISWRETYRGTLVPDAVLDSPEFLPGRQRFWTAALTDRRWAANRVAVAERGGSLIGVAMSGPVEHEAWTRQLYVLYVLAEHHGTGAGTALLQAVIRPTESAALWVGDPNPRAQAFYRKAGFIPDGSVKTEDGIRELRMLRILPDSTHT